MLVLIILSLILTLALGETILLNSTKWYPWELSPKALWGKGLGLILVLVILSLIGILALGEIIFGTSRK